MAVRPLPSFERPPVSEVALAVQFEPLAVGSTGLARLATALEDVHPGHRTIQERMPQPPLPARDGDRGIMVQLSDAPVTPMLWLMDESEHHLIQLQADRLVINWRKLSADEAYPSFDSIQPRFISAWTNLSKAASNVGVESLTPNACEVTYFNGVDVDEVAAPGDLQLIVAPWSGETSDSFLPSPESVQVLANYPLPDDLGTLSIGAQPARRKDTGGHAVLLRLSAQGWPPTADLNGVLRFFDAAHEWIVRGFASFTTKRMHKLWRRTDVTI